jgi:hypothetical protein
MTAVISGLFIFDFKIAATVVSGMLIFFASLEFLFAICVGCMIYTYFILSFFKK